MPLWWILTESNCRRWDLQSHALPTELRIHMALDKGFEPLELLSPSVFKTAAFVHSANPAMAAWSGFEPEKHTLGRLAIFWVKPLPHHASYPYSSPKFAWYFHALPQLSRSQDRAYLMLLQDFPPFSCGKQENSIHAPQFLLQKNSERHCFRESPLSQWRSEVPFLRW